MSSQVKSLTRSAREAIDRHDHATALRLCESGLQIEENNCILLVFKALCLQRLDRPDEAASTYRLACKEHSQNVLVWQGLLALYQDNPGHFGRELCLEPLERLRALYKDSGATLKHAECSKELIDTLERLENLEGACQILTWLLSTEAQTLYKDVTILPSKSAILRRIIKLSERIEANKIKKEVEASRFRLGADPLPILKHKVQLKFVQSSNLDQYMQELLELEPENLDLTEQLVDRLLKKIPGMADKDKDKKFSQVLGLASRWCERSAEAARIILDFCDWDSLELVHSSQIIRYHELFSEEKYGRLTSIVLHPELHDEQQVEEEGSTHSGSVFAAFVAVGFFWTKQEPSPCHRWLCETRTRIKTCRTELNFGFKSIWTILERLEGLLFNLMGRFEEAAKILQEILNSHPDDRVLRDKLILCYEEMHENQKAINLYTELLPHHPNDPNLLCNIGWQHFILEQYPLAIENLKAALALDDQNALLLHRLGRVYWEMNEAFRQDKQVCLHYFLSSAKRDPSNWEPFLYLGLYYCQIERDEVRGERCLTKSLSLNPDSLQAANNLATLWLSRVKEGGEESLQQVINLLEPFSTEHFRNAQMWISLGTAFAALQKWSQSTTAFQNALKADRPDELRCLLGLGRGYLKQNRLIAAMKAYDRILELQPDLVTAQLGLAAVDMAMRRYGEAASKYSAVLERKDNLAEPIGHLALLERLWAEYLHALDLLREGCPQESLSMQIRLLRECVDAISILPTSIVLWRLLSRLPLTSLLLHHLPRWHDIMQIFSSLQVELLSSQEFSQNDLLANIEGVEAPIKVAVLANIKIILYSEDEMIIANAWADLSYALLSSSLLRGDEDGQGGELLKVILDCVEQAVQVSTVTNQAWMTKGVAHYLCNELAMAQHCFIKALHRDPAFLPAWINLAILYFKLGETELALKALERVHLSEPEQGGFAWYLEAHFLRQWASGTGTSPVISAHDPQNLFQQAAEMCDAHLTSVHLTFVLSSWGRLNGEEGTGRMLVELIKIVSLQPQNGACRLLLALTFALQGDRQAALTSLDHPACNASLANRLKTELQVGQTDHRFERLFLGESIPPNEDGNFIIDQTVIAIIRDLCGSIDQDQLLAYANQLEIFTSEYDSAKTRFEFDGLVWLHSRILVLAGTPLEALGVYLRALERHFCLGPLWSDMISLYRSMGEESRMEAHRMVLEWMRIRVSTEMAAKIFTLSACETALELWGDDIPEEISRILEQTRRMHLDYQGLLIPSIRCE